MKTPKNKSERSDVGQRHTASTDNGVKPAAQVSLVRPSMRTRRIVQELVSLGRPITGNEFRARYGRHDTLAKIALIPWVRVGRSRDGFVRFTILEDLRDYCARYLLRTQLTPVVEELKRRCHEHRQWCAETQWVTRVSELIRIAEILNFVEEELDKVVDDYTYLGPVCDELHRRRKEYWDSTNRSKWLAQVGNLDQHGELLRWIEAELVRLL
jgi:hypothetical protein